MGDDIKFYTVTVPPETSQQMNSFPTKKPMNKDFKPSRRIIHNDRYYEEVESYAKKLCGVSSSSRIDTPSIGSNDSGE